MDFISGPYIFVAFLNLILIGYIIVEILYGEKYYYRNLIKRYENNLFDRVTHYLSVGILANFLFLFGLAIIKVGFGNESLNIMTESLDKTYNDYAQLGGIGEKAGIVISGIMYFIYMIVSILLFFYTGKFGNYMGILISKKQIKRK